MNIYKRYSLEHNLMPAKPTLTEFSAEVNRLHKAYCEASVAVLKASLECEEARIAYTTYANQFLT